MFSSIVIILLFAQALAQQNCEYNQNVKTGQTYYIYNREYPASYQPGSQCLWLATAPPNYQLQLNCTLEMQQTSGCTGDRLLISKSGDPSLTNAERYCGRRTLIITSNAQNLSVALAATASSQGGRFLCTLVAQQAPQVPQGCSCGRIKSSRIVGGSLAGPNEFIWMAGLIDVRVNSTLCGGVIIADRYVVSAAHCLIGISINNILISVGNSAIQSGQKFSVISARIHPYFNSENFDYDISILQTNATMPFSDTIGPICLPFKFKNADPTGATVTLLGWGTVGFGGPVSPNLLKVNTTIISQTECNSRLAPNVVTDQQFCTLTPGKDACQNDSGGPAVFFDTSSIRAFILGSILYGRICGSYPGVLTRMQNFTNWIVQNTPASYCVVP